GRGVRFVERGGVCGRIKPGGDDAQKCFAGTGQIGIVDDIAWTDQSDARLVESTLRKLPRQRSSLAGRHESEQGIRMQVCGALQERCKIRTGERHLESVED